MKKTFITLFIALLLAALSSTASTKNAGHDDDYRTFHSDGKIAYGKIEDSYTADLVMYLAGNQFMVMEKLIKDFQSQNLAIKTVYVETIPPGQILKKQLLKQGQINGKKTSQTPDLFASVNINHLKKLNEKALLNQHIIYTHNKLELMVAKGNPKNIKGVKDLARLDLIQSHPNPITEGIFKFYGSEMLKDLNIHEKVTGNKKCKKCWAVPQRVWFTERHHRETPHRIENNQADVGIVWATEVAHAKATGRNIEGITIKAPFNKQDKVSYVIGKMTKSRNAKNADIFLKYLATEKAQNIYQSYGFVRATEDELKIKTF